MSVVGGNWRIFSEMVSAARAAVQLNTSVTSIELEPNGADLARLISKYVLKTKTGEAGQSTQQPVLFDDVIIATPYQFSKISAGNGVIEHPIDEIPYITLHVTLFASPFQLSPLYFNLPPTADVPSAVLTTLAEKDGPTSGVQGSGTAGFYSVTVVKKALNPKTGKLENIYKIFSPEKVTPEFLRYVLNPFLFCCLEVP
jgi:prenylcysteine oxidase/farnesylcysteine lyase